MRHGFLLIDKPEGPTSHDVVAEVRRILHEPKIGHLGTLDPAAKGLLVLAVGAKALKVVELFKDAEKTYEARVQFGAVSKTYDREGPIEETPPRKGWTVPTERELIQCLETHFLGDREQMPPPHSAVHIDGKRAYEIVRGNPDAPFLLPSRKVHIARIQLLSYAYPKACIRIACSSGTYIRSLAHDLGQLLRCGAYLEGLKRLKVGGWKIEDACSLEIPNPKLQTPNSNIREVRWMRVIPLKEVLCSFPRHDLSVADWGEVQHGRSIPLRNIGNETMIAWFENLPVAILERDPKAPGRAHPRKVL